MKNYFLACAVLFAGLTSCNKSDDGIDTNNDGEKDLYIKIERTGSRADTGSLADGTEVSFSEGALYFTNAAGRILRYVRVTNESTIAGTLTPTQLEQGVTIEKVHGEATHVHLYGNFSPEEDSYLNLSDIPVIDYDSQKDTNFGVSKANLYGGATLNLISNNQYEATIYVAPVLARLEAQKLQAKDATQEGDPIYIASYTLRGIYINNYYLEVTPDGKASGSAKYYGQDYWKYYRAGLQAYPDNETRPEGIAGVYESKYLGYLFDDAPTSSQNTTIIGTSDSNRAIEPANGAWAYNVFAVETGNPHIVFHFTDVKFSDDTLRENLITGVDGEAYLTVTGYTLVSNDTFANIEGGKIYKMENVLFGKGDLGDVPEVNEKKDVYVKVELMPWKVVPVNPNFE